MSDNRSKVSEMSTEAKDYIRGIYDLNIIRQFQQDHCPEQRLSYLGLTGAEILDVLTWCEYIAKWTSVQMAHTFEGRYCADRIIHNALANNMEREFQLVRGDIDDVVGTSQGQSKPRYWPYQIVNLDYYGGLVHASRDPNLDRPVSKRLEALRGLFHKQAGHPFVLFLTLNLKDKDLGTVAGLVAEEEEDLAGLELEGVTECFHEHRSLRNAGLLKIFVPLFLGEIADQHDLIFSPPVLYRGTRPMIHFAVRCPPYVSHAAGRRLHTKDKIDLINLPLEVLHDRDTGMKEVDLSKITQPNGNR